MRLPLMAVGLSVLLSGPAFADWRVDSRQASSVLAYQYDPRSPYSQHPAPRRETHPHQVPRYHPPHQAPRYNQGIPRDRRGQSDMRRHDHPGRLQERHDPRFNQPRPPVYDPRFNQAPPPVYDRRQSAPPPGVHFYPRSYPSYPSYRYYRH